jgi:hypothetical protein
VCVMVYVEGWSEEATKSQREAMARLWQDFTQLQADLMRISGRKTVPGCIDLMLAWPGVCVLCMCVYDSVCVFGQGRIGKSGTKMV